MKAIGIILAFYILYDVAFGLEIGSPVNDFKLIGSDGVEHHLKNYRDKPIVLEWFNFDCPFVRKHYDSQNMQTMQKDFKGDVNWFTIVSSAKGKQGYLESKALANKKYETEKMQSKAILLDSKGEIGKYFNVQHTPHLIVIDTNGKLVFSGGIDNVNSTDPADVPKARNYLRMALTQLQKGEKIKLNRPKAYGCSVKY